MTIYVHLLIRLNNFNKQILVETGGNADKKKIKRTNMPKHTHAYSHTHIHTQLIFTCKLTTNVHSCTHEQKDRYAYTHVYTAIFMSKHRHMQIQITYA